MQLRQEKKVFYQDIGGWIENPLKTVSSMIDIVKKNLLTDAIRRLTRRKKWRDYVR